MEAYEEVHNVGEPTEKITLHISCRNLKDLDTFSKSDPICHVFIKDINNPEEWLLYGKTEQIENNLNPDFVTYFEMNYYFERIQEIKIEVFDVDPKVLEKIGEFETTLGALMGSHKTTLEEDLIIENQMKSRGKIILRTERVATWNDIIQFDMSIKKLKSNKGFLCGSNDPFIYIERARREDRSEFIKVIQTEPNKSNLNPSWENNMYEAKEIWNGDLECPLRFRVYSWRSNGYHKFYGEFETTLQSVSQGNQDYNLFKNGKQTQSIFTFSNFLISERPSFYDFLQSNWKIKLSVWIDFTASNGEVNDPTSLHYIDPEGNPNDYQNAIYQVWNILQLYDHDKKYPWLGFGGIPRHLGTNDLSHWFNLNGLPNPEVVGIEGIMEAYKFSLENWGLHGPSHCSAFLDFLIQNI